MIKFGFLVPKYKNEKRVVFFPDDRKHMDAEVFVEDGFGETLDISNDAYLAAGCHLMSRCNIFKNCDYIFSLKGVTSEDYELLRPNQVLIGFIQPTRQGHDFYQTVAKKKSLYVVDLDNIAPSLYKDNQIIRLSWIPSNFVYKNSLLAGYAAIMHATTSFGMIPNNTTKIAVLGSGNVSQGALKACHMFQSDTRMFYRKTMSEFYDSIENFDIIINGIELREDNQAIIKQEHFAQIKQGALIIDVAAVPDGAIQGIRQTSLLEPMYNEFGLNFYCVNNTPSLYYKESSHILNEAFTQHVFKKLNLIQDLISK